MMTRRLKWALAGAVGAGAVAIGLLWLARVAEQRPVLPPAPARVEQPPAPRPIPSPRPIARARARPAAVNGQIIVGFKNEGDHAVTQCVHCVLAGGIPSFQEATADRSASFDQAVQQHRISAASSVFVKRCGLATLPRPSQRTAAPDRRDPRAMRTAMLPALMNTYVLAVPLTADPDEVCRRFREDPHVEYCQPNYVAGAQTASNDPAYGSSGTWGQPYDDLWGLKLIRADRAWPISQGDGVIVAVIDTGADSSHEDLRDNIWTNPSEVPDNGIDEDGNGYADDVYGVDFANSRDADGNGSYADAGDALDTDPMDDHGHGTHVAGIIAAARDNGLGIVGVAPRVKLMGIKALDRRRSGSLATLARSIIYAVENGARVINASWACASPCPANPILDQAVRLAHQQGVVVVVPAGNGDGDLGAYSPQNLPEAITVSSTDHLDQRSNDANRGVSLDVSAPGGEAGVRRDDGSLDVSNASILSLRARETDLYDGEPGYLSGEAFFPVPGDPAAQYYRAAGTSMASPYVAGVAALILASHPEFSPEQVRQAIRRGSEDVGPTGFDPASGYGRLDAERTLTELSPAPLEMLITGPASSAVDAEQVDVTGIASGAGLASWRLEYGAGDAPTDWTPLRASSTPVTGDALATWAVGAVPDGLFTLRLTAEDSLGRLFEDRHPVVMDRVRLLEPSPQRVTVVRAGEPIEVLGTVAPPQLSGYALSIETSRGVPLERPAITLADGGSRPVRDGVLGTWETEGVPVDSYRVWLTATLSDGASIRESAPVIVDPTLHEPWPQPLDRSMGAPLRASSPILHDLDGDGAAELIVARGGAVWVLDHAGSPLSGWPQPPAESSGEGARIDQSPAVGDVTGDETPEIVASDTAGRVFIWGADGTVLPGWPKAFGESEGAEQALAIDDLNGDHTNEVIATDQRGTVRVFDREGSLLPGWPRVLDLERRHRVLSPACLGDLDGDGAGELAVANLARPVRLYLLRADGSILSGWPKTLEASVQEDELQEPEVVASAPAFGDLDGDGDLEVVIGSGDGMVHALHHDATPVAGWPQPTPEASPHAPALGDWDGDGAVEVVVGSHAARQDDQERIDTLFAWGGDGAPLAGWPIVLREPRGKSTDLGASGFAAPALADLDGDDQPEILVARETARGPAFTLQAFHRDGAPVEGFPKPTASIGGSFGNAPAAADVDGDGLLELAWADVEQLYVWDLIGAASTRRPWPMFRHDARHTGRAAPVEGSSSAITLSPVGGLDVGIGTVPYAIVVPGPVASVALHIAQGPEFLTVDLSNPFAPATRGGVELGTSARGIAVEGGLVYLAQDASPNPGPELRILDISDPAHPRLVGGLDVGDRSDANAVAVAGRLAYLGLEHHFTSPPTNNFRVVDVSNPSSPSVVGGALLGETTTAVLTIALSGQYAYVGLDSSPGNDFRVLDLAKAAPPDAEVRILGGLDVGTSVRAVVVAGSYAYLGLDVNNGTELRVIDISNPYAPVEVGGLELGASVYAIALVDRYALLGVDSNPRHELQVVDLSDPTQPSVVGGFETKEAVRAVTVSGTLVYIGHNDNAGPDLRILSLGGAVTETPSAQTTPAIQQPVTPPSPPIPVIAAPPPEPRRVLLFTTQPPETATAGEPFSRAPVVSIVREGDGTVVPDLPAGSTVTLSANGAGTLRGSLTQPFVQGAATFPDLVYETTQAEAIGLSATTSLGLSLAGSSPIRVSPANQPPTLLPLVPQTLSEGQPWRLRLEASDPDGDPLTYSVQPLPTGLTQAEALLSWTPGFDQAGSYTVTVAVSDRVLTAEHPLLLTVTDVNRPPIWPALENQTVRAGEPLEVAITADDSDGARLTLAARFLRPTEVALETLGAQLLQEGPTTWRFRWTPEAAQMGDTRVTLTLRDGPHAATQVLAVTVTPGPAPEPRRFLLFTTMPPEATTSGASFSRAPVVSVVREGDGMVVPDLPAGSTVTLSAAGYPGTLRGTLTQPLVEGRATFPELLYEPAHPNEVISLTATTSLGLPPTGSSPIRLQLPNQPPVLVKIADQFLQPGQTEVTFTVREGDPLQLTVVANDPEGDPLTYTADALPDGARFAGQVLSWTPSPTQAGRYTVTVTVRDPQATASLPIQFLVTNVNRPPALPPLVPQTLPARTPFTTTLPAATDPDEDGLTYTLTPLPDGATFEPERRTFSWTPPAVREPTEVALGLSVTDGTSSVTARLVLTITPVNTAPVITAITPSPAQVNGRLTFIVDEGQELRFMIQASDPDGDVLILMATGEAIDRSHASLVDHGDGTATFAWQPGRDEAGSYVLQFTVADRASVDDPERSSVTQEIVIEVRDVANQPPAFTTTTLNGQPVAPDQSLTLIQGVESAILVTASDRDGDSLQLSASLTVGNSEVSFRDAGAAFVHDGQGQGTVIWTPARAGNFSLTFIVSDGEAQVSQRIRIQVLNANAPHQASTTSPAAPVPLAGSQSPIEPPVSLPVAVARPAVSPALNAPRAGQFDAVEGTVFPGPSPTSQGPLAPTPSTFEPLNLAPAFAPIDGPDVVWEGTPLALQLAADDPEGQAVSLNLLQVTREDDEDDNPAEGQAVDGITFTDHGDGTAALTWTPAFSQAGRYLFTFAAHDGQMTSLEDVAVTVVDVQRPWQDDAEGDPALESSPHHAAGYHFTPLADGTITHLGGAFDGTKELRLFNRATGELLASATVASDRGWSYVAITPVAVTAGTTYTVAVYLEGSGELSRPLRASPLPRRVGDVRIEGSTYLLSAVRGRRARPTNTIADRMYGQVDIGFAPSP